jgi:hypothetical protein
MKDNVLEVIKQFEEDGNTPVHTTASKGFFDTENIFLKLPLLRSEKLYSIFAKLLYISSCVRTETLPTIAYPCTRVSKTRSAKIETTSKIPKANSRYVCHFKLHSIFQHGKMSVCIVLTT